MTKRKALWALTLFAICAALILVGYSMFSRWFGNKNITYKYDETAFANPLMGYAPDGRSDELCVDTSLVYAYVTWAELEPTKGEFEWDSFIRKFSLDRWRSDGKRLVFRFVCDYPTGEEHMDIPKWLYDETGDGEFYCIEYGSGYSPDYNNEIFIAEHERVIGEIGRFFAEDMPDFLAYVELGSLGHWGEWHTYYPAGIPRIPDTNVREGYVAAYEASFPYARLLMRRPFAERPSSAGVYNDMTGDENDTAVWLNWISSGGMYDSTGEAGGIVAAPSVWNYAPVGGEFTSGTPMSSMLSPGLPTTIKLIRDSHMTFIGPMVPNPVENKNLSAAAEKVLGNMGYRYWISSFEHIKKAPAGEVNVKVTVTNSGVAPIYFDWKMCLYVEVKESAVEGEANLSYDGGQMDNRVYYNGCEFLRYEVGVDLTKICEGQSVTCSLNIPESVLYTRGAKVYAGIEDPVTGEPSVFLAMHTQRNGKMSLLWEK